MNTKSNHAKQFALQLGSLVSLYLSLSFLLVLIFGIINLILPDATDALWELERTSSSIRIGIAMTLVFFPVYIALTRKVNQTRRQAQQAEYLDLTKWLIYLSLLVGGGVLLGSLVTTIMFFLEGEITTRFSLKVATILLIVGTTFWYYLRDAQGYWRTREKQSIALAVAASLIVVSSIVYGFIHIPKPAEVREVRLDNEMVEDLRNISWRVQEYYEIHDSLPSTLSEMYGEFVPPTPPAGRASYEYNVTGEKSYSLCTTFSQDMVGESMYYGFEPYGTNYNWDYKAGRWCFDREVGAPTVN